MSLPLIDLHNVTVKRGDHVALDSLSLRIDLGEHVAILGPNGSGKSTLIKTITRECYPIQSRGSSLKILGQATWNVFDLRPLLGIVSGDMMIHHSLSITGREAVLSGFFSSIGILEEQHTVTAEMIQRADEVLRLLEVEHLAGRSVDEMSSGEHRRILIGRALAHSPKALLFDEPTNSLDIHAQHEVRNAMRRLAQSGVSTITVTHHLPDIIPEVSRVILLENGRLYRDGPKQELLTAPLLGEIFRTPVEVVSKNDFYHMW